MAGSEKVVWWNFDSDIPEWKDARYRSVSINKHDGEGFPKLGNPKTCQETRGKIAELLGIEIESVRFGYTPWGVDYVSIRQKPTKVSFESIGEAVELSAKIYDLCQLTREEWQEIWKEMKENLRRKQEERGYK